MKVFGLLGREGGCLKQHCDSYLIAPGDTADRIQEIHIKVLHILIEQVERLMFPKELLTAFQPFATMHVKFEMVFSTGFLRKFFQFSVFVGTRGFRLRIDEIHSLYYIQTALTEVFV